MVLEELELPINHIKGIGPESYRAFSTLGISLVRDLLTYYPVRYEDRLTTYSLSMIQEGFGATYVVEVISHKHILTSREKLLKVIVSDGTGEAELVCFGRSFLVDQLLVGKKIYLFANFSYRYDAWQSSNFEFETYSDSPKQFLCLLPVYSTTAKLSQHRITKSIEGAFALLPQSIESLVPSSLWQEAGFFQDKNRYIKYIHSPTNHEQLQEARRALAFEELFLFHVLKEYHIAEDKQEARPPRVKKEEIFHALKLSLPFTLTEGQEQVLVEITTDLMATYPMKRLLQADVGAGKTLVALLSATYVLSAGQQVVLLAPTELLAKQHAHTAYRLLTPLGIEVAFLSGNLRTKGRLELLGRLASGEVQFVVGTHALFSDDVEYHNLGYVIVDEQHRFGVHQRTKMHQKAPVVDLLLMSATPIPQTLQMSYMGNMAISTMHQLPPGRKPIMTHLVKEGNEAKVYALVKTQIDAGRQAYFVYPLIEQQEKDDRRSLMQMYEELKAGEFASYQVGMIHSRMDEDSKKAVMDLFVAGNIHILFSTSVVEVGVDVPNATLMVVYNAERFGLATLHQLRGRIGRGEEQGRCFFVYHENLSEIAKERLKILYETTDGFMIAEEDLRLRGPGELGGLKQSGFKRFALANITEDYDLWQKAHELATFWMEESRTRTTEDRLYQYLLKQPWFT